MPRSSSRTAPTPVGKLRLQLLGFLAAAFRRALGAAFREFGDAREFEPDSRPALGEAVEIAVGKFLLGAGLHPAHGIDRNLHPLSACGSVNRLFLEVGRLPHLLDVVELPDFRTEDMDDDIARIDQHPVGAGQPLDARLAEAGILQRLEELSATAATWRCDRPDATTM